MRRLRGYGLMLVFAIVTPGTAQPESVLDLTTPQVRQRDVARTAACGSFSGGIATSGGLVPKPELSLALQLESLDQTKYEIGQEVVAAVRLTNVGANPVTIPWSPDPETIFGKNCQWRPKTPGLIALNGMIGLEFRDETGFTQSIASHGLYGISNRPDTLQTLHPGESAFVKIWGTVGFYQMIEKRRAKGLNLEMPQLFSVAATFDLQKSSEWQAFKTLRSEDGVQVEVTDH